MSDSRSLGWPFIIALWLVAAVSVARYGPHLVSLLAVTVDDRGWPLTVDAMVADGWRPSVEFGYFYGLLTVAIDRAWFALCGRTPFAAAGLTVLGCAVLTHGLLRFARAAQFGTWQRVVFVCAVPFAVMPLAYPTPLHAIEAALLVHALASQAAGRLAAALVFATLAVYIKPALGYFHGLALVLLVLTGRGGAPDSWRERWRTFIPAAVVAVTLAVIFAAWFGIGPLLTTQFPFRAMRNYGDENFGFFFGTGRAFWEPVGNQIRRYLLNPVGFWLIASGYLIVGAVRRVGRLRDPLAASVVTAAVLHVVFVALLFGNEWSWLYYSALLVCGFCTTVGTNGEAEQGDWPIPLALAVIAVAGMLVQSWYSIDFLNRWERSPATAGLYADPGDSAAWQRWRALGTRQRVMVYARTGGAAAVFPELDSPRVWFLLRSTVTPMEVERVHGQLRAADYLIVAKADNYRPPDWPEFRAEMEHFTEVEQSPSFRLLKRKPAVE